MLIRPSRLTLFAAVLFAGCIQDEIKPDACVDAVCPPDTSSADYTYALSQAGLTQVAADPYESKQPRASERLIVWQDTLTEGGEFKSRLYGVDLQSNRLFRVGEPHEFLTRHKVFGDRVVYETTTAAFGATSIGLWKLGDTVTTIVASNLSGNHNAEGVDERWVLIVNGKAPDPSTNGLWAVDFRTGEQVHVAGPRPSPDGRPYGLATGRALADGRAYYALVGGATSPGRTDHLIMEYDIANRTERELYRNIDSATSDMAASKTHVAWMFESRGQSGIRLWDRSTGRVSTVSDFADGIAQYPTLNDGWLVYSLSSKGGFSIVGLNLTTGQKTTLAPFGGIGVFSPDEPTLSQDRLFVVLRRNNSQDFDTVGEDIYWKNLPS